MPTAFRPSIAVIGAGAAGIISGYQLKHRLGVEDFTLYEKEAGVGGTWHINHYPGAQCDVWSHAYSFSFDLNPSWSQTYANADEIKAYMTNTARKFGLMEHVKLGHELQQARWNDGEGVWELTFLLHPADGTSASGGEGKILVAKHNILISGGGGLYYPRLPAIPGIETFKGPLLHSARWPTEEPDLEGKSVAVIGTGASAVQIIEKIADRVGKLTIFQRSSTWYPKKDLRPYSDFQKWMFRYVPFAMRLHRYWFFFQLEASWSVHIRDSYMQKLVTDMFSKYYEEAIADPKLRQRLTPPYPTASKRIIPQVAYLDILQRPGTELVDAADEKIVEIDETGVWTEGGDGRKHRKFDLIVAATGFETSFAADKVKIIGREGLDRAEKWQRVTGEKKLAAHYKTIMTSGFPNYFMLFGPNSVINTSIIFVLECEVDLVIDIIRQMIKYGIKSVEPKEDAQWEYTVRNWEDLKKTVWAGVAAWYNPDGRSDGRWPSTYAYPGRSLWWETRSEPELAEKYVIVGMDGKRIERLPRSWGWMGTAAVVAGATVAAAAWMRMRR
ncbi:hypothetical protein DFJ74DRAFT_627744 [Hyaloraphidium curvatum]|nr:hypothetical protein DFJ74DRAFT_627744 [Hyaloraphidium curvatum]